MNFLLHVKLLSHFNWFLLMIYWKMDTDITSLTFFYFTKQVDSIPQGGGVLPNMGYIGMCGLKG